MKIQRRRTGIGLAIFMNQLISSANLSYLSLTGARNINGGVHLKKVGLLKFKTDVSEAIIS